MFRGDDWLAFSNTVCVVCFNRNYIYLFKYKPSCVLLNPRIS